jgi:hypothetical protein
MQLTDLQGCFFSRLRELCYYTRRALISLLALVALFFGGYAFADRPDCRVDTAPHVEYYYPPKYTEPSSKGMKRAIPIKHHAAVNFLTAQQSPNRERVSAVGAIYEKGAATLIGTATLIADDLILTAWHVMPQANLANRRYFVLGDLEADELKNFECYEIEPLMLAGSHRGHLDYVIMRILPKSQENLTSTVASQCEKDTRKRLGKDRKLPCSYGTKPLIVTANHDAIDAGNELSMLALTQYPDLPRGLAIHHAKSVLAKRRYIKDSATSVVLDYQMYVYGGNSGGPLFNQKFEWVGIHQRTLCSSKYETLTDWHPYLSEYHPEEVCPDEIASLDEIARFNTPRQGTPMSEIVEHICTYSAKLCDQLTYSK